MPVRSLRTAMQEFLLCGGGALSLFCWASENSQSRSCCSGQVAMESLFVGHEWLSRVVVSLHRREAKAEASL
jgi:hypothetical protein